MTPLAPRLQQVIATEGPISVARFMDLCLNDPVHGYYRTGVVAHGAGRLVALGTGLQGEAVRAGKAAAQRLSEMVSTRVHGAVCEGVKVLPLFRVPVFTDPSPRG